MLCGQRLRRAAASVGGAALEPVLGRRERDRWRSDVPGARMTPAVRGLGRRSRRRLVRPQAQTAPEACPASDAAEALRRAQHNPARQPRPTPPNLGGQHLKTAKKMAGAWGVIASLVPAAELPALELAVGCSLIEKCTDLRNEADALRDIVEDYAQQNARDAESVDARAQKRAQADRLGVVPEREMLERKVSMLLDYLGGAGSEAETRVAAYVRRAAAERARQIATPPKKPSTEKRTPPPAPKRPMDALADLFIDRGDSSDVVAEARRLLEREAEDLVEEIARLTTFFDEEELWSSIGGRRRKQ